MRNSSSQSFPQRFFSDSSLGFFHVISFPRSLLINAKGAISESEYEYSKRMLMAVDGLMVDGG